MFNLTKHLIPYLRPLRLAKLIDFNIVYEGLLSKAAFSKKQKMPNSRLECKNHTLLGYDKDGHNLYPIYDSKRLKTHTHLAAHNCISHIRKYTFPGRTIKENLEEDIRNRVQHPN